MTRHLQVRVFMINNVKISFTVTKKSTCCHLALRGQDFNWDVDAQEELNRTLAVTYYNSAVDLVNDNADFDWIAKRSQQTVRHRTLKRKA